MDILPETKRLRRKLSGQTALLGIALYTACFVFARLEVMITSDILMVDSLPAKLLSFLQTLAIVLGFALFYSFTSVLCHYIKFKRTLPFIFLVMGITLYRALLSLGGRYFIDGITGYDFFLYILPSQVLSFGLEVAQYLLVLLIVWISLKEQDDGALRRSQLLISLTVMLLNIASRILYDIGYGAPTSSQEFLQMGIAYASDILLYGVLLFFAMHLLTAWAKKTHQRLT